MTKKLSKMIKITVEKNNRILLLKKKKKEINKIVCLDTDYDDDGLETLKRYKPRSLDELASRTKFSKKEIQLIYQGFKQECPSGMIDFFNIYFFLYEKIFIKVLLTKTHLNIFMDNFSHLLIHHHTLILSLPHLIYVHQAV